MITIELKDILINARQEAVRMRHHYLGVEHLFIAMLSIRGGLTSNIIAEKGLMPDYVIGLTRRKAGKGGRHRLWAGIPNAPRTDVVLGIADEIMREQNRLHITERDLLIAILEEADSIPLRVLKWLKIDLIALRREAETRPLVVADNQAFVSVDIAPEVGTLNKDHLYVLRRMFRNYSKIRVEARLTGGYTRAVLLVVTPIQADGREDATVVVKIDNHESIHEEAERYEKFVKTTLPPLTARLEDTVIAPDFSDLAGLKYTFLTDDNGTPRNLRTVVNVWDSDTLGIWLSEKIFDVFGINWWKQNRPYRFEAWQEYDWLLPPVLTLEILSSDTPAENSQTLKFPIKRSRLNALEYGEVVIIENFIVHDVDTENHLIRLALGQGGITTRPYQIEVRGINFDEDTYFKGEVVDSLVGRIWRTRNEELDLMIRSLQPDFDSRADFLQWGSTRLPNPLRAYNKLLDMVVVGTLSTLHGDMHLGNVLVGMNKSALLIDFGHTREGHTLFDWATLEVSLLNDLLTPHIKTWQDVRRLLPALQHLTTPDGVVDGLEEIVMQLAPIRHVRNIVRACLAKPSDWSEYWLVLAFVALRAVTWETLPTAGRQLQYAVSALAMANYAKSQDSHDMSTSPDATEFTRNTGGL